jgi:steroid 5-alpha reductase family enzyme
MVSYLAALVAIAIALSALMAGAWVVRDYTGNSGWVDTIWTFSVGLVGAASALWPLENAAPNARQWLVAALVAVWSLRLGTHIAVRTSAISDDPRYAAFAKEWGPAAPQRMGRQPLPHEGGPISHRPVKPASGPCGAVDARPECRRSED